MRCHLSLALVFALVPVAGAQHYHITDLGSISPVAINVWGQVAGNLNNHAVVWTNDRVRDLGVLPGGTFTEANAINDLGAVAGTGDGPGSLSSSSDPSQPLVACTSLIQPFVWSPHKGFTTSSILPIAEGLKPFDIDDCNQKTYSTGINLVGQVTATNQDIATYVDGYFWNRPNGISMLVSLGYQDTAVAINDFGVSVGQSSRLGDLPLISQGAVYKGGVGTLLPVLSPLNPYQECSGANSINDLGKIAGWDHVYTDPSTQGGFCPQPYAPSYDSFAPIHATLWQSSAATPTDLGTLSGDIFSVAVKINSVGVVVGMSGNSVLWQDHVPVLQVVGRPFLWDRVQGMRDLNDLIPRFSGWTLQSVSDINGVGQIVGTGTKDGEVHGFLLTPSLF